MILSLQWKEISPRDYVTDLKVHPTVFVEYGDESRFNSLVVSH